MHESTILSFFQSACIAYTVEILLQDYGGNIRPPLDLLFVCHAPYKMITVLRRPQRHSGGGGPAPQAATRIAASTSPPSI